MFMIFYLSDLIMRAKFTFIFKNAVLYSGGGAWPKCFRKHPWVHDFISANHGLHNTGLAHRWQKRIKQPYTVSNAMPCSRDLHVKPVVLMLKNFHDFSAIRSYSTAQPGASHIAQSE
jgi:hypothetical protein